MTKSVINTGRADDYVWSGSGPNAIAGFVGIGIINDGQEEETPAVAGEQT